MKRPWGAYVFSMVIAVFVLTCSNPKSGEDSARFESMADCPDRPNCVSSEAQDAKHTIDPFRLKGNPAAGWDAIVSVVVNLPRSEVVKQTDRYLHTECKSRLFGFVDDLELRLDPMTGVVAIRSASRVGYSDWGVNRRRVEALRQILRQDGIIQ